MQLLDGSLPVAEMLSYIRLHLRAGVYCAVVYKNYNNVRIDIYILYMQVVDESLAVTLYSCIYTHVMVMTIHLFYIQVLESTCNHQ